jgi:hypothetical protein
VGCSIVRTVVRYLSVFFAVFGLVALPGCVGGSSAPTTSTRSQSTTTRTATKAACHPAPVVVAIVSAGRVRRVSVPAPVGLGSGVVITGLSALSPRDVWAVGNRGPLVGTYALRGGSVIAHWDGKRWRLMAHPRKPLNALVAVLAISTRDVWAVGAFEGSIAPGVTVANTLAEHWDGSRWRVIPTPNSNGSGQLQSIVALASDDVWAAGGAHSGGENVPDRPLVEHWDGTRWTIETGRFSSRVGYTRDLAAQSPTSVSLDAYDGHDMLVKLWDGRTWHPLRHVRIDRSLVPAGAVRLRSGFAVLHGTIWRLFPSGMVPAENAGAGVSWPVIRQNQARLICETPKQ